MQSTYDSSKISITFLIPHFHKWCDENKKPVTESTAKFFCNMHGIEQIKSIYGTFSYIVKDEKKYLLTKLKYNKL